MGDHWTTDDGIALRLAAVLQLNSRAELSPFWESIFPDAHDAAYNEVVAALVGRGYTISQVNQWDRRTEYEIDLSLWWSLVKGEYDAENNPQLLEKLDRRPELLTTVVTIGGVIAVPTGEVQAGDLNTANDIFQLEPGIPFRWEQGYTGPGGW